MEMPKIVVFAVKRFAVREARKLAVRSTQCQKRAVRSTQEVGGVTLIGDYAYTCNNKFYPLLKM